MTETKEKGSANLFSVIFFVNGESQGKAREDCALPKLGLYPACTLQADWEDDGINTNDVQQIIFREDELKYLPKELGFEAVYDEI